MPGHITVDGWEEVGSTENRPLAIDFGPEMDVGDVVGQITLVTLTDLLTGASYSAGLSGAASSAGTIVTQAVSGLLAGRRYRLVITVNMGGTKLTASGVNIVVPF